MSRKEERLYRAEVRRDEAADHIERLAEKVESGAVTLSAGEFEVKLAIPRILKILVESVDGTDEASVIVELKMTTVEDAFDETHLIF